LLNLFYIRLRTTDDPSKRGLRYSKFFPRLPYRLAERKRGL
jgi:hypothetical protein